MKSFSNYYLVLDGDSLFSFDLIIPTNLAINVVVDTTASTETVGCCTTNSKTDEKIKP